MSRDEAAYPLRTTRNHWMNWVETHATMRPDAPAFRYLGQTTTWAGLHDRVQALARALGRQLTGDGPSH